MSTHVPGVAGAVLPTGEAVSSSLSAVEAAVVAAVIAARAASAAARRRTLFLARRARGDSSPVCLEQQERQRFVSYTGYFAAPSYVKAVVLHHKLVILSVLPLIRICCHCNSLICTSFSDVAVAE